MPIKVLQVIPSLQIGGAEQVGVFLASEFGAAGRAALYAVNPGPLAAQLQQRGVAFQILNSGPRRWRQAAAALPGLRRVWRRLRCLGSGADCDSTRTVLPRGWPYAASPRIARQFAALLREGHYDAVHLHSLECAALIPAARQQAGAVVFSQHNILSQRHSREDIEYLKRQLIAVDMVVCPSQASRSDFLAQTAFPPSRTQVIPNPSLLAGDQRPGCLEIRRFGTISNLGAAKGIDVFLQAWKRLRERGICVELQIAGGDASVIRRWQSLARELRLVPPPFFMGQLASRKAVKEFYRQIDVALIPSRTEAFSLVAAEAMSQAIPVIASDIPALREVLGDAAVFFPSGDAEALAQVVAGVYDNPRTANQRAAAGYARWQRWFQTPAIARQYGELYRSLTLPAAAVCTEARSRTLRHSACVRAGASTP